MGWRSFRRRGRCRVARIRKERRNDQKGRRDSHPPPQLSAVQIDRVPDDICFFVNYSVLYHLLRNSPRNCAQLHIDTFTSFCQSSPLALSTNVQAMRVIANRNMLLPVLTIRHNQICHKISSRACSCDILGSPSRTRKRTARRQQRGRRLNTKVGWI